jgi:hypothetical protein
MRDTVMKEWILIAEDEPDTAELLRKKSLYVIPLKTGIQFFQEIV